MIPGAPRRKYCLAIRSAIFFPFSFYVGWRKKNGHWNVNWRDGGAANQWTQVLERLEQLAVGVQL